MPCLEFSAHESTAHKAIVVSLDLAGFSDFCNQPEASVAAPKLAKHFFDLLNTFIAKVDDTFFIQTIEPGKLTAPDFIKFTGDGALMIWVQDRHKDFPQEFCNLVVKSMRDFQLQLVLDLPKWEKQWHVHKLPKRVRVGIATGIVYALRPPHSITMFTDVNDYVGYCINLAVRLQNHCSEIGFLVHGDLHSELAGLVFYEAIQIKGAQTEPVAMFLKDRPAILSEEFRCKFKSNRSL